MVKWAIELNKFIIKFATKTIINGQALADFIIDNARNELTEAVPAQLWDEEETLDLCTEWSISNDRVRVELVLTPPTGEPVKYAIVLTFKESNNIEEYKVHITNL